MRTKTTTSRLPGTLDDELQLVARVDGLTSSAAIRVAVERHLTDREAGRGLPESLYVGTLERAVTARLPGDLADELDRLARADNVTSSAVIREAIRKHVAARKADPTFHRRLMGVLRRDLALARAMAPAPAPVQDGPEPAGGDSHPVAA